MCAKGAMHSEGHRAEALCTCYKPMMLSEGVNRFVDQQIWP